MLKFFSNPISFTYFIFVVLGILLLIYGFISNAAAKKTNVLTNRNKSDVFLIDKLLNKIKFVLKKEEGIDKKLDILRIEKCTARKITKLQIMSGFIGILISITLKNFMTVIPLVIICGNIPTTFLNMKLNRRLKEYNEQILESFQLFVSEYTTTKSVPISIQNICPKIKAPLKYEYERLSREINSGASVQKCFEDFQERTQNKWTLIFSKLILNYYEKGGSFVSHLMNITKSITMERIMKTQNHTELFSIRIVNIFLNLLIPICYISNKFINPQEAKVFANTPTGRTIMFCVVIGSFISLYFGHKLSES